MYNILVCVIVILAFCNFVASSMIRWCRRISQGVTISFQLPCNLNLMPILECASSQSETSIQQFCGININNRYYVMSSVICCPPLQWEWKQSAANRTTTEANRELHNNQAMSFLHSTTTLGAIGQQSVNSERCKPQENNCTYLCLCHLY
jgi:hypothetical protein